MWPVAWLSFSWSTLTGLYEESLGFRYFYSLRLVHEPQHFLFLAQGHLVTLVHQLLQVLLDAFLPVDQLLPRIDVFARHAVILGHAATLAAFAWALRPALFDGLRVQLAALWVMLYYASGWDGYYVLLSPDYHAWIPAVGLCFLGIMARALGDGEHLPARRYAELAALGAFGVGVKITLGALAAVASVYFLLVDRPGALARRRWLAAVLAGELGALGVLALCYRGSLGHVSDYLFAFAQFMASSLPVDAASGDRLRAMLAGGATFGVVALAAVAALLVAGLALAQARAERALAWALLLGAALYAWLAAKRLTPVMLFEAAVFAAAALSLLAALAARRTTRARWALTAGIALAAVAGTSFQHPLGTTLVNLRANDVAQARLRSVLGAVPGRVAFLIDSNEHQFLSLEGALFKGTSDLATPQEADASPLARRLLGERDFFFGGHGGPPELARYAAVAFTVPAEGDAARADEAAVGRVRRGLELQFHTSLAAFACTEQVDFRDAGARHALVCRRPML